MYREENTNIPKMSVQEGRNRNLIRNDCFHEHSLSKAVICSQFHGKMVYEYELLYFGLHYMTLGQ